MSNSQVLNSEKIDLDEYYLKNDLFNYVVNIVFDEKIAKLDDPLLLFRLELNTHSNFVSINDISFN
jgi:hypothetical protein